MAPTPPHLPTPLTTLLLLLFLHAPHTLAKGGRGGGVGGGKDKSPPTPAQIRKNALIGGGAFACSVSILLMWIAFRYREIKRQNCGRKVEWAEVLVGRADRK